MALPLSDKKRRKAVNGLYSLFGIDPSEMTPEEAGKILADHFTTKSNRTWDHRMILHFFRNVQRGELYRELIAEGLKEVAESTHNRDFAVQLIACADLSIGQYSEIAKRLGQQFDDKKGKYVPIEVNGVRVPKMLLGRTATVLGWTEMKKKFVWDFVICNDNPEAVAFVRPLTASLNDFFRWPFTRQLYTESLQPGDKLDLSINLDAFPIAEDLDLTLFSMAVTNIGMVSKSPLLRFPLGVATCSDQDRDEFTALFEDNINLINNMIDTGVVHIKTKDEGGVEKEWEVPVSVR